MFAYHLWELTYPNFLNSSQNFKQRWTCIKTDAWICETHEETIEIHGFANSFYLSLTKVLGTQGGEKWISSEISLGRDIIQMQEDEIWSYSHAQTKPSFTHCSSEQHTAHLKSDEDRASLFFKEWDDTKWWSHWFIWPSYLARRKHSQLHVVPEKYKQSEYVPQWAVNKWS